MIKATKYDVESWIKTIATGEFYYKEVLNGQVDPSSFSNLRKVISQMCKGEEPLLEPIGRKDGWYRVIQDGIIPVDWQGVEAKKSSPLILPFDLRKYVFIYPNTVIIVAGSKSSGKTGFLYRTVALNMLNMNTILLSNMEGGKEQLRDRFFAMDIDIPNPAPFAVLHVTEGFHDYIKKPNTLYVIDYIDAPEGMDFYLIGAAISKIRKKLMDGSVAVIGLQKPLGRDTAFGGEQTLKDATLYIALDNSKLKIVDAKVPANKKIHPKNMAWSFLYSDEGTNFENIQPYHGD